MPKRGVFALVITAAALVLLLNFQTPDTASALGARGRLAVISTPPAQSQNGRTTSDSSTSASPAASAPAAATPAPANGSTASSGSTSGGATALKSGTFTGSAVDTPFGALQVQVTVSGGKITNVQPLQYPSSHGRSVMINQYALPQLVQQTLQAQSAQVDGVSGATWTSDAYAQSLQSALDQAHG